MSVNTQHFTGNGGKYLAAEAILSDCGVYRYQLERRWADGPTVLWIMLNPSTADGRQDDRTIGRCVDFSKRWGFGALLVGNLYGLRATDPEQLADAVDPIGPRNGWNLSLMAARASLIVAAWGGHCSVVPEYVQSVIGSLGPLAEPLRCLGRTKAGAPRHPLYLAASTQIEEYSP